MNDLKSQLYGLCRKYIENSISEIEQGMSGLREAMHGETKSSMGDKYETTREMLQQDINMNRERLNKVKADEAVLNTIYVETLTDITMPGSLVYTNNGNFYIAISAGHFVIGGVKYYAISLSSPIGMHLKGKRKGDSFTLNGREYIIEDVQ